MAPAFANDITLEARKHLLERRSLVETAVAASAEARPLARLRAEVDEALARIDRGTFGLCAVCHDPLEPARLLADPLARTCLGCMSAAEQRALERDLDLASRIQRTLLPPRSFRSSGWEAGYEYQAAGAASGDYVDWVPLDDGELLFVIGDVSGKGVAASLLMTHLHAIVRSLVALRLPFAELVEQANRIFHNSLGGHQYATLLCGKAGRDRTIELANAGHCPPLLLRGSEAMTLPATSVPVGLFANAPYPTLSLTLQPGDSLVLYTDGVTEMTDADGRDYGRDRLAASAIAHQSRPVADFVSGCLADLEAFRAGADRQDDVTLFVLRRA